MNKIPQNKIIVLVQIYRQGPDLLLLTCKTFRTLEIMLLYLCYEIAMLLANIGLGLSYRSHDK